MDKEISSRILKFTGQVEIPEDLAMESYLISLNGEVKKIEDGDNDDGTITRTFKFAPITGEILKSNGQITKTKDARSRSKQMRATIRREWLEKKSELDEEEYYDQRMAGLSNQISRREWNQNKNEPN